jgi:hypothetical protein
LTVPEENPTASCGPHPSAEFLNGPEPISVKKLSVERGSKSECEIVLSKNRTKTIIDLRCQVVSSDRFEKRIVLFTKAK